MTQSSVLIVEDDLSLREALCDTLALAGYPVSSACDAQSALDMLAQESFSMVVSDVQMPRMDGHALLKRVKAAHPDLPVLLMTAYGTIQKAVAALHDGAADYLVKPFDAEVLVNMVSRYLPTDTTQTADIVAEDVRSRELLDLARRVAGSDASVLLSGASGVGKEVLARYIHRHSKCAQGPFVAINCAAIPDNMLEAVLFGYEKGAFTGAYQGCPGKFEQAQGGTLLLDEISEMDLGLQAKLLRVLQEREVERLGGRKTIALTARVLATTNRRLREEVAAGRFREDLFYRLNVFPLHIPPLRERPRDILPLAQQLIARHCAGGRAGPSLAKAAQARLLEHAWPGNVRELDNVVQRALIMTQGAVIDLHDLHFENPLPSTAPSSSDGDDATALDLGENLKSSEARLILAALSSGGGSRKAAAAQLGISPRTLRYKLARLRAAGLELPRGFGVESA
ncbi:MAG: sigma-54-dependent transcriptional regulator [Gammaproteobacteria bacterium]